MLRHLLAVIACGALCVGVTEAGASAGEHFFHSPSGNIQCEIDVTAVSAHDRLYCQTFTPARSVTSVPGKALKICTGTKCLGNGPEDAKTLAYGTHVTLGPFRCTSLTSGVRCTVTGGHGFAISRSGIHRL